jgi:hypothetical protein
MWWELSRGLRFGRGHHHPGVPGRAAPRLDPDPNGPGCLLVLATGDWNAIPGSFEYDTFTEGGYDDTHLASGNAECNAGTGEGCTGGRDSSLAELESTASNADRRIDYIFSEILDGESCGVTLDSSEDIDSDGIATGTWADIANPFETCGASPNAICWPSEHNGNEVDVLVQCNPVPMSSDETLWILVLSVTTIAVLSLAGRRSVRA